MNKDIISENQSAWERKSWINDFFNDKKFAKSLTESYADDVLEAVAEDYFPSLDAAIADLQARTGLTASEVSVIKTAAIKLVAGEKEECEEEIPGNKSVAGDRLVKESPEEAVASSTEKVKVAGIEHLKEFRLH